MNSKDSKPMNSEDCYVMYSVISREALAKTVDKKGNLEAGKLMVQAQHANLHTFFVALRRFPKIAQAYMDSPRAFKSCLVVDTEEELRDLYEEYKEDYPATLVEDAGFTVYDKPTVTMVGIGPLLKNGSYPPGSLANLKTYRTWKKEV